MDECPFCRIAAGEKAAHVLYEDDRTMAFLDENPATAGHALVIPHRHAVDVVRMDEETALAVFRTARRVARAMDATTGPDGFSVFHTSGDLVGTVEHAHLHLLPREADDDVHLALDRDSLDPETAAELVEQVRAVVDDV